MLRLPPVTLRRQRFKKYFQKKKKKKIKRAGEGRPSVRAGRGSRAEEGRKGGGGGWRAPCEAEGSSAGRGAGPPQRAPRLREALRRRHGGAEAQRRQPPAVPGCHGLELRVLLAAARRQEDEQAESSPGREFPRGSLRASPGGELWGGVRSPAPHPLRRPRGQVHAGGAEGARRARLKIRVN